MTKPEHSFYGRMALSLVQDRRPRLSRFRRELYDVYKPILGSDLITDFLTGRTQSFGKEPGDAHTIPAHDIYLLWKAHQVCEANRPGVTHAFSLMQGREPDIPRIMARHNMWPLHIIPIGTYQRPHDLLVPDVVKSDITLTMRPWVEAFSHHLQLLIEDLQQ